MDINSNYQTELNNNGVISVIPSGCSMWPFLKNKGQSVIISKIDKPPKKFDVCLFVRKDGTLVLHRVVGKLEDLYLLQGDSQNYVEKVELSNIIGIMEGFYKGKKYIPATDQKYLKKVEKWCKRTKSVQGKIKRFYLKQRIKSKLKRMFQKGKK